jgi:hypothetical protein
MGAHFTRREQVSVIAEVYSALREKRPNLFDGGEAWGPGGVSELASHIGRVLESESAFSSDDPETTAARLMPLICAECHHRTSCGYCLVRQQHACVMLNEAVAIAEALASAIAHQTRDTLSNGSGSSHARVSL